MTDFGRDISCTDTIRTGRYASGNRLIAEAIFRRLSTPHGMLQGGEAEADYGLDLTDLIGSVNTKSDAASLPGQITSELLKDERIESVDVVVTPTTNGPAKEFEILIDVKTASAPFSLTIGVSDVSIQLLGTTADTQ